MPLQELCRFLSRLVRIPVTIADTPSALRDFCENARFHRVQEHLTPERLGEVFSSLAEAEILSVNDAFQIRFILFKALGTPVIFGPFCSESLSTIDARILLERSGVSRSHAQDFLAYRAAFTVTSEQDALRAVRILVFQLTGLDQLPPIRSAHFAAPSSVIPDTAPDRPYAETVSERYAVETDMMRAIEHGNTARALTDWRQLHQRMDYLKKQLGYTLGNAQFSAAVTRTVIRVAGMNAGVPAHILDDLTGRVSQANRQAKTLDEIEMNTERLIRDLCREIRHREKDNVSYLTESVKYQIHTHFHEDLTVAAIAPGPADCLRRGDCRRELLRQALPEGVRGDSVGLPACGGVTTHGDGSSRRGTVLLCGEPSPSAKNRPSTLIPQPAKAIPSPRSASTSSFSPL